jgi:hypothetical protein
VAGASRARPGLFLGGACERERTGRAEPPRLRPAGHQPNDPLRSVIRADCKHVLPGARSRLIARRPASSARRSVSCPNGRSGWRRRVHAERVSLERQARAATSCTASLSSPANRRRSPAVTASSAASASAGGHPAVATGRACGSASGSTAARDSKKLGSSTCVRPQPSRQIPAAAAPPPARRTSRPAALRACPHGPQPPAARVDQRPRPEPGLDRLPRTSYGDHRGASGTARTALPETWLKIQGGPTWPRCRRPPAPACHNA